MRHREHHADLIQTFAAPLLAAPAALLGLATAYLIILLGAARFHGQGTLPGPSDPRLRCLVLIPAHDEEAGIAATLASLRRIDYPPALVDVVVVADNCGDRTAAVARAAGARVLERSDPDHRGKGFALAWALERLATERPEAEAVVLLDADCSVSPNFLTAIATRLATGTQAVQVNYVVANPDSSWSSGLRYAAFALFNTVHPLGKSGLGLSAGLLGTGMGFSRDLLARYPWQAFSLSEDADYHMRLVAAGEHVAFAPEATVASAMPTSLRGARDQQLRWEGGRVDILRRWTPRLLRLGLRRRSPDAILTAIDPLVPPQSLLLGGNLTLGALSLLTGARLAIRLSALSLLGQLGYILAGLRLTGAPASAYRSLALAPLLMVWKLGLYARILSGRGPVAWVKTPRGTPGA